MSKKNESSWQALVLRHTFVLSLLAFGYAHAGNKEGNGMQEIEGSIWYRERIALPPSAQIHVHLEDAARMDSPSEVVASASIDPQGGPPWSFTLPYDPETLHDRGRYVMRVRIEAEGRLLFVNTQSTPAFFGDPSVPLKIRVSQVASSLPGNGTQVPDASLIDTYWKLVELDGQAAGLGAGDRELHMVLTGEGSRVRGFSGCNRFTGGYQNNSGQLTFTQLASTRMACMEVRTGVSQKLGSVWWSSGRASSGWTRA